MLAPIARRRRSAIAKRCAAAATATALALTGVALTGIAANAAGAGPEAGTTAWSTPYQTSIVMNLCEGATDAEGDTIALAGMDAALDVHGAFDSYDPASCMVGWTPDAGFSGLASFGFSLTDGTTETYANGSIEVGADPNPAPDVNTPPAVADDAYSTPMGVQLVVADPGVFANDADADGDAFSLFTKTDPSHGTVIMNNAGGFFYKPAPGYAGPDSFTYTAIDAMGNASGWATVAIDVQAPADQAPTASAHSYQVALDTPLALGADWRSTQLLVGATDPEGDALTVTGTLLQDVGGWLPGEDLALVSGSWTYTPPTGFAGTRHFGYLLSDGTNVVTGDIDFVITAPIPAPVAVDDAVAVAKGAQLVFDPTLNDQNLQGYTIVWTVGPASAGFVSAWDAHTITYEAPDLDTTATLAYRLMNNDFTGALSDWATVTITVGAGENHAPVAVDDLFVKPMGVWQTGNVLTNDSDPDGDALTVTWGQAPTGTLQGGSQGAFSWTPPVFDWSGVVQIPYTVHDVQGGSDDGMLTITTAPDVEAPVALEDAYATVQDQTLHIDAAAGLLANDSDADTPAGQLGLMVLDGQLEGAVTVDLVTGAFDYTPTAGFTGTTSFVYLLHDPAAHWSEAVTVTIAVLPADGATPFAQDDHYAAKAYTDLVVGAQLGVLANDADPNGDAIHVVDVGAAAHGDVTVLPDGGIVYSPDAGFVGEDTVQYRVSDGTHWSNWATIVIEVAAVPGKTKNEAPSAIDHAYGTDEDVALTVDEASGLLAGATDPDSYQI
ncbi:MAG: tandem-95 repeat protein, partial [Microbacteriaceae bacterium]|nr:tandem-95 repeat protein [Microbacteriaceae bacterium]